jgi:tRNA pseudouridine55 synthase
VRDAFVAVRQTEEQIPPKYSAKKINGRRACDLVREGADFELKSTKVKIYSIDINSIERQPEGFIVDFDVRCSKGTYIRALARDIGKALGLSHETIRWYRKKLIAKFDVSNTAELISIAKEMGLI